MSLGTVTWVIDADGNHEVSSAEHLLQLMNKGSLYTDAGDAPASADYWAETSKYVQTADVDLLIHHEHISPIGNFDPEDGGYDAFLGTFDGRSFSILNWAGGSTDPYYYGLFGVCNGSTLQNIRLAGVWTLSSFKGSTGFLCGGANSTNVFNCEGDFDPGTSIANGSVDSWSAGVGGLLGVSSGTISGLTLRGTVDFSDAPVGARGGVIGKLEGDCTVSHVRNLATFPNGITSTNQPAGGIIGNWFGSLNSSVHNVLNAMQGDISANVSGGGVFGRFYSKGSHRFPFTHNNIVNAMTGNVSGGGIVGKVDLGHRGQVSLVLNGMMNYMNGSALYGGLIGEFESDVDDIYNVGLSYKVKNSIVAMKGHAGGAVIGRVDGHPVHEVDVVVNTDFGMTYDTNDYTPATSVGEGFLEFPMLPGLPYVDLGGTDEKGNVYDWDFVYANVGGKEKYSAYTHASLHSGKMSAPFFSDFGEVTGRHLALANVQTGELFTDGAITAVVTDATTVLEYSLSTLETQASPIAVTTTVIPVAGAVDLKLTYQAPDGEEQTAFTGFLGGVKNIDSLDAETQYTLRLYADMGTGAGYEFQEASIASTPANTAENYRVEDFVEDGKIRLDRLSKSAKARMSSVMNELFSTGDDVELGTVGNKRFPGAKFVNRGGTHPIKDVEALLLPFDADSGSSQMVNLQLSDDSTTAVLFDELANTVSIGSSVYTPGDIFVIDGLKCTVFEDV